MNLTIEVDTSLNLQVSGHVKLGTLPSFDSHFGNHIPGDSPEVTDLKVSLNRSNRSLEIPLDALPSELVEEFMDMLIEHAMREGDAA